MFIIVSIPNSTCWVRWMYPTTTSHASTEVTRVNRPSVNSTITSRQPM